MDGWSFSDSLIIKSEEDEEMGRTTSIISLETLVDESDAKVVCLMELIHVRSSVAPLFFFFFFICI